MRKIKIKGLVFLTVFLLFFSGCSLAEQESSEYKKTIETARTEIWRSITSGRVSSASLAIMKDGEIIYEEGFAMADRLAASSVNTDTQFNIGSVSKVFTSVAIMQLVDEGKISLDEPVVTYITDFTMLDERYKAITVRMLLNHASGLPGTMFRNGFAASDDPEFLDDFMDYLSQSTLKSDPGSISVYCNDGFTLAEVLIERISGMTFADYLSENIFDKTGMDNSSCSFIQDNQNIALTYNEEGIAQPKEIVNLMGTGGLSSTAGDLCRFGWALEENKLITPESFAEMSKSQYGPNTVPSGTPITSYGLGWDMVAVPEFLDQGVTVLSKNGATLEYSSQFYVIPDENIEIALIYSGNKDVTPVTNEILQALLEELGIVKEKDGTDSLWESASIPAEIFQYSGIYGGNETIWRIRFDLTNQKMIVDDYIDGDFVELEAMDYLSDGYFHSSTGIRYSFSSANGKNLLIMTMPDIDDHLVVAEFLQPAIFEDTSAFEDRWWIPINLSAVDLYVMAVHTNSFSLIPGLITSDSTVYALNDAKNSKMILSYARDLADMKIVEEDGVSVLNQHGYQYLNPEAVPGLTPVETLVIEENGRNVLRQISEGGNLQVTVPEGGRVVVFDNDYSVFYDSLFESQESIDVPAGSVLLLSGMPQDSFEVKYSF